MLLVGNLRPPSAGPVASHPPPRSVWRPAGPARTIRSWVYGQFGRRPAGAASRL